MICSRQPRWHRVHASAISSIKGFGLPNNVETGNKLMLCNCFRKFAITVQNADILSVLIFIQSSLSVQRSSLPNVNNYCFSMIVFLD